MTQRQVNVIKILLPFIGTIFLGGVAWQDLKGDVGAALPEDRFEAESIRTDASLRAIMEDHAETRAVLKEINARLLETCLAVRSGCR